ncbi:Phosphorylase b kinase regulatory subunit [Caenorhabditis elegans]|uniref:Phosphorylase b kinase regulatory subunit n=7 Tax=Caenorhabditis elegans TaxID=6239 RepID=H2L0I6_CAEEL|nr:Phosphorylase b kinase regulatory subunit [Caenorhabditis elegans]CCD73139.1 Phosphorylase b kinase regulatory subunit [Caenorhabditis elegans]|eukprot:NP_500303.4 Phosphorylase b kinase regulatory subunit [Caenorhabditis elegans]
MPSRNDGPALLKRRSAKPFAGNLRLRRLTKAYLEPLDDNNKEMSPTVAKIDQIYDLTQELIVQCQSVTSGLFPRYSKDRDVGYVKDSIYCAMACWACSVAYKRLDDDRGRQTELRQTAVKTMRGILFSWMQQSKNLDAFKSQNSSEFALHARFDLSSGMGLETPNDDLHYGHLQMDLVALYLLTLVQMISAGCKVIYTHHEVNFIQNLVFYIERTYRTPDFGMWERGTRYNNGKPELHASSLGMVKAALEAINGFNLYGSTGTSASVIYVDIDGHNRNRTTFETILPRESNSKNTDAALLMTVGWPAFATHDETLFEKTMQKCVRRLEGRFGLRRFHRDGFRTELEDNSKSFYDEHETAQFQGVESQFPIFLACISLTAYIRANQEYGDIYFKKLQKCLVADETVPGGYIVPECYCVDEFIMDKEREQPNSTELYALSHQEFGHHLWSNAIYIILMLKREGLIHSGDIDPINRHLPASQRPKMFNRHSAFQGSMEGDPVVQVALISESPRLQMMLSTYGITTQTPHEVEPVQIWPSWRMVKVFECLGRDKKLDLSGRPQRPFGPLSTSKVFRVFGDTVLCYPLLFEVKDFYVSSDPAVLIDDIKRDIEFVARRWKLAGRPTMCVVLREENVAGEYFDHILDLLVQLKNGHINGIRVRLGRVHQLLNSCCIEHIDFANSDDLEFDIDIMEETHDNSAIFSRLSLKEGYDDDMTHEKDVTPRTDHELFQIIEKDDMERPRLLAFAIWILWSRTHPDLLVHNFTLRERLEKVYRRACQLRLWWLVRYCAGRLHKAMNSLAPAITNMLVRGKQITLGVRNRPGAREEIIVRPIAPSDLNRLLFECCPADEPQAAVFHQELIIACSDLMSHNPQVFEGVLTIRLSWLSDAISMLLNYVRITGALKFSGVSTGTPPTPGTTGIPTELDFIRKLIRTKYRREKVIEEFKKSCIYDLSPTVVKDVVTALMTRTNWHLLSSLQTRRLNGALNRMPVNFYDRVWTILERSTHGIIIADQFLPQQPTLSDMTRFELTFSYKIEAMLSRISHPEYRQLLVELLSIIATILERNPEIAFTHSRIDCDSLIKKGFALFAAEEGIKDLNDLTPFYQLEGQALSTSTATFLTKAVVEFILAGRHFSQVINIFGEGTPEEKTLPSQHHRGKMPKIAYTGRASSEKKKRHVGGSSSSSQHHHHHQQQQTPLLRLATPLTPEPSSGTVTPRAITPSPLSSSLNTSGGGGQDESCRLQ